MAAACNLKLADTPMKDISNAAPVPRPASAPAREPLDIRREMMGEEDYSGVTSDGVSLSQPPDNPALNRPPVTKPEPTRLQRDAARFGSGLPPGNTLLQPLAPPSRPAGGNAVKEEAVLATRRRMRNAYKSKAPDVFEKAKAELSIPDAWHALGLPGTPAQSCLSPFRIDRNPSFSVYDEGRHWKDHGTSEGGDVIEFIAMALGANYSDVRHWLMERLVGERWTIPRNEPPAERQEPTGPARPVPPLKLRRGTEDELQQLAALRGLGMPGIDLAQNAGVLRFIHRYGHTCYAVTDNTRRATELRRLDGQEFQNGTGTSKAAPLSGVDKSWLPGAVVLRDASPDTNVLLVEGATDLLTAFDLYADYLSRDGRKQWAPVALLGAGCKHLNPECAELIRGQHVRIVADGDDAGDKMRNHWAHLLHELGCTVDRVEMPRGKDLSDIAKDINSTDLFS